ncbi:MAG: metallophosphoesterase [Candidatus Bathyarchaeia archaeon]
MTLQQSTPSRLGEYCPTKVVGLISDTHIPVRAKSIPKQVLEIFEKVDFIVHAGDLVQLSVIDELEQFAPVLAVYGNMDGPEIRGKLPRLNSFRVFEWRIGVMHDPGALFGFGKMREIAKQRNFDVLAYGHTHSPNIKWDGKILFINPGSPTNPLPPFITKPTIALLRVTKDRIMPEIIQI